MTCFSMPSWLHNVEEQMLCVYIKPSNMVWCRQNMQIWRGQYCLINWSKATKIKIYTLFIQGDLISVHSEDENNFIDNLTGGDVVWLGASKRYKKWRDDTRQNYKLPLVPCVDETCERKKKCLMFDGITLKWQWNYCKISLPFVCKKNQCKFLNYILYMIKNHENAYFYF